MDKIPLWDFSSSGRLRNWRGLKKLTFQVAGIFDKMAEIYDGYAQSYRSISHRLSKCGEYLVFESCNCGQIKRLVKAAFCRVRLCPLCQWRKSLMIFDQVKCISHELMKRYPGIRFLFVTLTVPNCPGDKLNAVMDNMSLAYDRMLRQKTFASVVIGSFRSFDHTFNPETDEHHPHLHLIWAVSSTYGHGSYYVTVKDLESGWKKAMKLDNEWVQVNIKKIGSFVQGVQSDLELLAETGDKTPLLGNIAEVAKYSVSVAGLLSPVKFYKNSKDKESHLKAAARLKFSADIEWQARVFHDIHNAFRHRRLHIFTGVFRKVRDELNMPDVELSDLVQVSQDETPCQCPACKSGLSQIAYLWDNAENQYWRK